MQHAQREQKVFQLTEGVGREEGGKQLGELNLWLKMGGRIAHCELHLGTDIALNIFPQP